MLNCKEHHFTSKTFNTQWSKPILTLGIALVILGSFGSFFKHQSATTTQEKQTTKATNRIFGRVMDVYTEAWLSGVKVSIDKTSTMTDAKGNFVLNVPDDPKKKYYRVDFYKKGYMKDYLDSIPVKSKKEILIGLMKEPRK